MTSNIYDATIRATLTYLRSSAETPVGIAKAILKEKKLIAPTLPLPQPWLLDALKVGSKITLSADLEYAYRFSPLPDGGAQERAAEAIGKRGQRSNYGRGLPQIYGVAYQARYTNIHYKGRYKGYKGSFLHWNYQSCIA